VDRTVPCHRVCAGTSATDRPTVARTAGGDGGGGQSYISSTVPEIAIMRRSRRPRWDVRCSVCHVARVIISFGQEMCGGSVCRVAFLIFSSVQAKTR